MDVKVKLLKNNWDSLNPILNNSAELNRMLDEGLNELEKKVLDNIAASGSGNAENMKKNLRKNTLPPTRGTGIKMRFISIPRGAAFEMKYSVLGRALDAS